jgi:DNA polymerase
MKVTSPTLYCDLETFSAKDIRAGSHAYAADPSAEVLLWGYAIDDAPAKVWDVTAGPMPEELRQALDEVARKERRHVWQNGVMFDRVFLSYVMPDIVLPMETLDDTMVMAYQAGLPGSLKELCQVFHLSADKAKDADGSRLIQIFCKPLPSTWKLDRATSKTHPEEWAKFVNYCRLDIESMREVYKKLPAFNRTAKERELQVLDATINMRGIGVDVEFAEAAIATAERAKKDIDKQVFKLTDGRVVTAGQRDALIQFFFDKYGWQLKDMRKSELEKRMEDPDIPAEMKELIGLRLMGTKTSVQKYKRVVDGAVFGTRCAAVDGRVRGCGRFRGAGKSGKTSYPYPFFRRPDIGRLKGCMQFRGASRTGRVSGRYFQPQNLPRPLIKSQAEIEQIIEYTKLGILEVCYDDVSVPLSSAIRSVIVPAAGNRLCVADFSNVEGRVLAWLAGEEWKLEAFREFDTLQTKSGAWALPYRDGWFQEWAVNAKGDFIHKGHDLYKLTYARTFGIKPEDVTKDQRQMGKVLELALGYQGGPGAFATFAMNFGMDLDELAKTTEATIEESYWIESTGMLKWAKEKKLIRGMSQKAWVACNAIKSAWRKANSEIESFWYSLAKACQSAIKAKGVAFSAGRIVCKVSGNYLLMRLPSGRYLVYPAPRLPEEGEMCDFSFMGVNQYTKKWERIPTYSGKLAENSVQGAACDLLLEAGPRLEAAGYHIVMSVHDEYITEIKDDNTRNHREMEKIMSDLPDWAEGLPLVAAGFEAARYRKD